MAVAAFFVANPYAFIDHAAFHEGLKHQSAAADDALGKLGLTQRNGTAYYLWTFTWGLGYVPILAAVAGVVALAFRDRRALARARSRAGALPASSWAPSRASSGAG